jgi:hypothetical protein
MLLAIAIPPLRTLLGGWTNFAVNEESRIELIIEYFLDPVSAVTTLREVTADLVCAKDARCLPGS